MSMLKFEPALKSAQRTRQERKKVRKMPLAHFLYTNEIPILNRYSVGAYQQAYKQDFIRAKLKELEPGKFWSWRRVRLAGYELMFGLAVWLALPNPVLLAIAAILALVVLLSYIEDFRNYRADVRSLSRRAEDLRNQLQKFAQWEIVPFDSFVGFFGYLKNLPAVPENVLKLASRVEHEMPGTSVFVEYFEQDPFLFVEFDSGAKRESYYIAVWGQEGFTHGEV